MSVRCGFVSVRDGLNGISNGVCFCMDVCVCENAESTYNSNQMKVAT